MRFGHFSGEAHSSIQQTYDRYGHLFPQMDHIADDLDAAYQAARSRIIAETSSVRPLTERSASADPR